MTTTTPDWLAARGGRLAKGLNDRTWMITIDDEPQYRVEVAPAKGQHTAVVLQTNNARRLDERKVYPTADAALAGGLDELRGKLGW